MEFLVDYRLIALTLAALVYGLFWIRKRRKNDNAQTSHDIIMLALAAFIVFAANFDTARCPKCDQKKALMKTGAKWGSWFNRRVEWKCKYCGYRKWKDKYREDPT